MELNEPYAHSNTPELFISISDEVTKRYIAKYILPVPVSIYPSHRQVNLVLRSVSIVHKEFSPCIRISVKNQDASLSSAAMLQNEYTSKMIILECFLRGIVNSTFPFGCRCIAALKIVHDSSDYLAKIKAIQKRFQEDCPTVFPQLKPHAQLDFDSNGSLITDYPLIKSGVPHLIYDKGRSSKSQKGQGYYQMTASTQISSQPEWNEHFMSFNAETALVVEFYRDPYLTDTTHEILPIEDLLAYAIIPLGDFSVIAQTEARSVLNLDNVLLNFVGVYQNFPETEDVFCAIDIKVPSNWAKLKPTSYKLPQQEKAALKPVQGFLKSNFEQLLDLVKLERENELRAAAEAAEEPLESKQLVFTYADVSQRQRLIDRLLLELEDRSKSIQKVGSELVASKERNEQLEGKVKQLEAKLRENETKTNQLLNTIDIKDVPLDELQRRYTAMAERLKTELARNSQMSKQIESANLTLIERNDYEKKCLELQQAHMAQQSLLQKLQVDVDAMSHTKATIKKQESVISKLATFLKDKLPLSVQSELGKVFKFFDHCIQDKIDEVLSSKEPDGIEVCLHKILADETAILKARIRELEEQKERPTDCLGTKSEDDYYEVLFRAETSEVRVAALEEELARNAKEFAKRLADMQKQLIVRPVEKFSIYDSMKEKVHSKHGDKKDEAQTISLSQITKEIYPE
ncbi:hypothetical protein HDU83_001754 [Entophlyctis luteolus]|nr:hypothetical protein HDU83_001754 [Entophlyctis luteolus]